MGNAAKGEAERAAIAAVVAGDPEAFAPLVAAHKNHVARIVSGHVPRDQVEDVCQEVFVRAFRGLAGFDGQKPLEHWLSRIAVRCCCDYWRSRPNRDETPFSALFEDGPEWIDRATRGMGAAAFERETEKREAREFLEWGLSRLSPEDRMVLTLTCLEERGAAETAELMGISVANVKIRAFRSRNKLRRILSQAMEGDG